ncbi:LysR family transcriptional regulator [Parasporobacterium paucivorans]|uniref:DNA-binding transcriptional regulator, LysR family n=1 Tax=Parasporobacterium paucivorans DSM 15970 TaxID=1122934 RepID=A0A1M6HUN5_9FIRM|nr:LysR family transcriptional regulator [Parasporobacterium paucivorans]SHJ25939.1 DNA-binding transcriptional regulator, LysR family [Parasporobacterium paucivorans DSM 15970]
MDINQLEIFITAAQYLNFTKAAIKLSIVQSAVSYNVATLEDEVGAKLFYRHKNKLTLTTEGESFLRDAYKMTSIAKSSIAKLKTTRLGQLGELHLAFVFPEFIEPFLPELNNFHLTYPDINTHFMQYDSVSVARKLEKEDLDIAFGRKDTFIQSPKLRWKSLYKDPFKLVLNKNHPLAIFDSVTPQMLVNEKILTMNRKANPGMFDMITHLFMSNGIVPLLNDNSNHHYTTLLLASINDGVVIIPYQNIKSINLPPDLVLLDIDDPHAQHEIGVAWNEPVENLALSLFLKIFGVYE